MASRLPVGGFPKALRQLYAFFRSGPNFINDFELLTSGTVAKNVDTTIYETQVVSGGLGAGELLNIGNGATAKVGQRKLITLKTRTGGSDVVTLDKTNMVKSDGSTQPTTAALDAAGEFVLVEWNGTKWQVVYFKAGVIT